MRNPTDHDTFEARLRDRLHAGEAEPLTAAGPDQAIARARSRRRNRRTALASVAALALVAGVGTVFSGDDPDQAEIATSPVGGDGVAFDWRPTDEGLHSVRSVAAGDLGLYVLSTAPGARWVDHPDGDLPRALYRLDDDGTWVPVVLGDDDPRATAVVQHGDALYALSTAPGSHGGGDPLGSVSTDGGQSWSSFPLDTVEAPSDTPGWYAHSRLQMAATAEAAYGLVTTYFTPPYDELFPELEREDHLGDLEIAPENGHVETGFEPRPEGLALVARAYEDGATPSTRPPSGDGTGEGPLVPIGEETVRTVPWSELGVDGPEDLAPAAHLYRVDGDAWNPVELPAPPPGDGSFMSTLAATGDAIVLAYTSWDRSGAAATTAHRSVDGAATWTEMSVPGGTLAAVGDALVTVGDGPAGDPRTVEVSRDAGATWSTIDLRSVDPRIDDLGDDAWVLPASGPLGLALVLNGGDGDDPLLAFSSDLASWTVQDLHDLDPDADYFGEPIVGADQLVITSYEPVVDRGEIQRTKTLVGTPIRG